MVNVVGLHEMDTLKATIQKVSGSVDYIPNAVG